MRATILQLFCIGLALHGLDGQINSWTTPAVGVGTSTVTATATRSATDRATIMVSELIVAGTQVATATATSGTAGAITYDIADTASAWGVTADTGAVYLHSTNLDFTRTASYTVSIVASEAGGATNGTLTIIIRINAAPYISRGGKRCNCNIATGTGPNQLLHTFTGADENNGDKVTFALTGAGNTDTDWAMSPTGTITTNNALVNAVNKYYTLSFTLTDTGDGTAAAQAIVSSTISISVGATGTKTSCGSCTESNIYKNNGAAAIVGSIMLLLAACVARFL